MSKINYNLIQIFDRKNTRKSVYLNIKILKYVTNYNTIKR